MEIPEKPKLPPPTEADSPVEPCTVESFLTRSAAEVTPDSRIAAAVITVTGNAPSAAMRLIDEPVISTR